MCIFTVSLANRAAIRYNKYPNRSGSREDTGMKEAFLREIALLGEEGFARLAAARVAGFGIGGVGSYAAEALVRAGSGAIALIDGDAVAPTNLNRQLVALYSTIGKNKAEVMAARAREIAPDAAIRAIPRFFTAESADAFDFSCYDYVADCIDRVEDKILLLTLARAAGAEAVSCMGAGNKFDPTAFRVTPVEKTRVCPLARLVRKGLRDANVTGVWAVYSEEEPLRPDRGAGGAEEGERLVGSLSYVPASAGLLLAGHIIRSIARKP